MAIRVVSMFSGIGGFDYGLKKASKEFQIVWANDNDGYACQIYRKRFAGDGEQQKDAEAGEGGQGGGVEGEQPSEPKVGRDNFGGGRWDEPSRLYEGDIRAVDADAIPEHDLLCAGFPCQSFSIAGKRRGFKDTRGTLFFEICRAIRAKRPSYLFLENVKGLLSHDDGNTFETIIGTLDELGYDCQWQVLNSKDFGVPQNRERVFIVGHTRGKPRPKVFPIGEDGEGVNEGADETPTVRTLQGGGHSGGHHSGMTIIHENKSGKRTPHKEAQALRGGASHNYQTIVASLKPEIGEGDVLRICDTRGFDKPKSWHFPEVYGEVSPREIKILEAILRKRRRLNKDTDGGAISLGDIGATREECDALVVKGYLKEDDGKYDLYRTSGRIQDWVAPPIAPTVRAEHHNTADVHFIPETAQALQTDGQLRWGASWGTDNPQSARNIRRLTPLECERLQGFPDGWTEGISDTQRYKCLGNAVTVNVIEAIGRQFIRGLDGHG